MDYNQNYQSYQSYQSCQPTPDDKTNSFALASMVCGIISIVLCCTVVFSLPLGALGIMFAVLSRRLDKPLSSYAVTGIILSSIGTVLGLIACICILAFPAEDSEYTEDYPDSYEDYFYDYYDNYGDDYEYYEYYEDFYDYGFEDL